MTGPSAAALPIVLPRPAATTVGPPSLVPFVAAGSVGVVPLIAAASGRFHRKRLATALRAV